MLILFDIDATLISTSGAGIRAMEDAARSVFHPDFAADGIDYAGRLDPLIIGDFFNVAKQSRSAVAVAEFRAAYGRNLATRLVEPGVIARPLPGVPELLRALQASSEVTLGLLTGNFPETGTLKLKHCGIDPEGFRIRVWGDESPHDPPSREHLPAVALERYHAIHARRVDPSQVTVIGDTPHDVRCARVNGCRSLAVATGRFGTAELRSVGADLVVEDLSSTQRILEWLLSVSPESRRAS
ncbi:MAG: haloacid dehalogenase-like hydrolase [Phycisphaeraceae bacterium]|nr:haloacid dehalogenase-like hydrolase [Phycisphaeraceae bacterium]